MAAEFPDFDVLANSMRTAANGMEGAASEMQKMINVPVINVAAELNRLEELMNRMLREMGDMRTDIGNIRTDIGDMRTDIGDMRTDTDRRDTNNFARILNSKITSDTTLLEPLLSRDGQQIPNFPGTSAQIHDLDNAAVNNLLIALGLPLGGRIEIRKNRVRRYIGLTIL